MAFDFPASPTVGQVYQHYVWDGQAWQAPGTATVIAAAPFDALAYNGMQVNGGMDVSQEWGNTPVAGSSNSHAVDNWAFLSSGSNVTSAQRSGFGGNGFPSILVASVTTAQAVLGATDLVYLTHKIEAWRMARLYWGAANATPITICFWVQHVRPGTYTGAVRNAAGNRSYVFTYTQNVANQVEYKTVTIPGDTTGTWAPLGGNGIGILLNFTMAHSGSYATATPNTWLAGNYVSSTSQVNAVAATSDVFRITGVVVLPGIAAPTAAQSPLIMRPYDQELLLCKRYLHRLNLTVSEYAANLQALNTVQTYGLLFDFPVELRATPSITASVASTFSIQTKSGNIPCNNMPITATSKRAWAAGISVASGLVGGESVLLFSNGTGAPTYLQFDARL